MLPYVRKILSVSTITKETMNVYYPILPVSFLLKFCIRIVAIFIVVNKNTIFHHVIRISKIDFAFLNIAVSITITLPHKYIEGSIFSIILYAQHFTTRVEMFFDVIIFIITTVNVNAIDKCHVWNRFQSTVTCFKIWSFWIMFSHVPNRNVLIVK